MALGPLLLKPFLRPMVWGGSALATRLGKHLPTDEPYGESWELSDHPLHRSVVAEGPHGGKTLTQLMQAHTADLLGPAADKFTTFPWLIKFLDCCDWLSVQVHPDAEAVKTLCPGEGSKTEAWYVIDAKSGSRIYAGLKRGVGPQELRSALAQGRVADCVHSFTPRPGDCVFLRAGTVHAVGGGVLMAEVQETSDATFRLFDWNRVDAEGKSRKLHMEEALAAIHWEYGPVEPLRTASFSAGRHNLVNAPEFVLELVLSENSIHLGGTGRLQALVVLDGEGRWSNGAAVRAGQVWVLPASSPVHVLECQSRLQALLVSL